MYSECKTGKTGTTGRSDEMDGRSADSYSIGSTAEIFEYSIM